MLIFLNQNEQSHESSQKKKKENNKKISYIPDQLKPDESLSGRASVSLPTTQP